MIRVANRADTDLRSFSSFSSLSGEMQRRRPNTTMYLPAFRRSRAHTRATRSGTPPSSRPSADIVNREYVLSRLIALRRPAAVCAACSGHANTSGSPREDLSRFLVSTLLARCFELRPISPAAFEFSLYRTVTRLQTVLLHSIHCKHQFRILEYIIFVYTN